MTEAGLVSRTKPEKNVCTSDEVSPGLEEQTNMSKSQAANTLEEFLNPEKKQDRTETAADTSLCLARSIIIDSSSSIFCNLLMIH